jgi:geranylgeranyl pyrophosphate synthase
MTDWVNRINQKLDQALSDLDCPCPRLAEAMHYAVCNGGKRTRATLTYLIGTGLELAAESIDPIAMAIECLHAYTLVHDDLPAMDDDDWRRHQPSCHKAFDEATAILAGDALQTYAFELLSTGSSENKLQQITYFSQVVGATGLCAGQSLDMTHTADSCELETTYRIHHLKTGVLLGACCRLPGIAAGLHIKDLDQLQAFGEALGLLLQINDDLIDSHGDTGKSTGKDHAQNKASIGTQLDQTNAQQVLQQTLIDCHSQLATLTCLGEGKRNLIHKEFLSPGAALLTAWRWTHR